MANYDASHTSQTTDLSPTSAISEEHNASLHLEITSISLAPIEMPEDDSRANQISIKVRSIDIPPARRPRKLRKTGGGRNKRLMPLPLTPPKMEQRRKN